MDMNVLASVIPAGVGIIALVIGWFLARASVRARQQQLEQQLQEAQQQQHELEQQLSQLNITLATEQKGSEGMRERMNELFESQKHNVQKLEEAQREFLAVSNELRSQKTEVELSRQRIEALQDECKSQQQAREKAQDQVHELRKQLQGEQTRLEARQQQLDELQHQFEQQKIALKNEFRVLSESILKERQQALGEQNREGVGALLKPLQEQIDAFQKRINDVHSETIKGNTSLEAEIKKVMDVGLKMREDASNLTSALKGDSQQRGAWGEAQLERTLEMSGLVESTHYEKQTSFVDAQGNHKRTDYLIKLPDNKQIIIDSKVSLVAYEQTISAASEDDYLRAMQEHVRAVKRHIDELAAKDYTNLIGMRSPSFVLMFMPIEPAYIEALKQNKELFNYGYERGVVLVSHTTLIPILRTVANLWMMERSNREAREISDTAGDIFNKVRMVAERLEKLGKSLNAVSSHYNMTVKALAGKQGLYGKVERFEQLSSKVSKTLPELPPLHADFEVERLTMIAEPLDDSGATEPATIEENTPAVTETESSTTSTSDS